MKRPVLMVTVVFVLTAVVYADSLNCLEIGYYDTPGRAVSVAVSGNYAYVADGDSGLRVIEFYGQGIEECFQPMANGSPHTATVVRNVLRWEKTGDRGPKTGFRSFWLMLTAERCLNLSLVRMMCGFFHLGFISSGMAQQ